MSEHKESDNTMNHFKFYNALVFLSLLAIFFQPTAVSAAEKIHPEWIPCQQGLGRIYEGINTYKAIEYHKKRIQNSTSEAEKQRSRKLLRENYARAIDSAQGDRKAELITEAHAYLPDWWLPSFLLAIMKYEEFQDALLHSDNSRADRLIKEASDFATSATAKEGFPQKYQSTCKLIIRDHDRTKKFTITGMAQTIRDNRLRLMDDNREYLIDSIPEAFIRHGLIKAGDILKVVIKPRMVLAAEKYGSHALKINGYNFLALHERIKPGYILSGKIIIKKAGSFIVASDNRQNIIVDIPKKDYDFFTVGDTITCRVYHKTGSYPSARHLSLYEIDPASYQTVPHKED